MWGEWIPTVEKMERQIYPRIAAYAEVGWTPLDQKEYRGFVTRMKTQLTRWDLEGVGYATVATDSYTAKDFFNHVTIDEWTPKRVGKTWTEVEFTTAGAIKTAGEYEVAFVYKKGQHAIDIDWVSLCENGKQIAKDEHDAFSGGKLNGVVYKFTLNTIDTGATYVLKARIKGSGGTDSFGEVKIQAVE